MFSGSGGRVFGGVKDVLWTELQYESGTVRAQMVRTVDNTMPLACRTCEDFRSRREHSVVTAWSIYVCIYMHTNMAVKILQSCFSMSELCFVFILRWPCAVSKKLKIQLVSSVGASVLQLTLRIAYSQGKTTWMHETCACKTNACLVYVR